MREKSWCSSWLWRLRVGAQGHQGSREGCRMHTGRRTPWGVGKQGERLVRGIAKYRFSFIWQSSPENWPGGHKRNHPYGGHDLNLPEKLPGSPTLLPQTTTLRNSLWQHEIWGGNNIQTVTPALLLLPNYVILSNTCPLAGCRVSTILALPLSHVSSGLNESSQGSKWGGKCSGNEGIVIVY